MLKRSDNERLTQVGPDSQVGKFFSRFWVPILLSTELPEPNCPPVKFKYLNMDLVAFRDSEGRLGVLDAYCPHRRANLFWGRNEEGGLRCAYHGWKFDVEGNCVDMPNCPEGDRYKERIKTRSYPVQERGGYLWIYAGPKEKIPPLPKMGWLDVPTSHRYAAKVFIRCNWLQALEGDIDSSHVPFLHGTGGGAFPDSSRVAAHAFFDKQPKYLITETPVGARLAARRLTAEDDFHWRVSHWLMPSFVMVASPVGTPHLFNARIPIDNTHTLFIRLVWHPDRPLTEEERHNYQNGGVFFPELLPGTFWPKENMDNHYLIDREAQRTRSWTGIKSVPAQDWAVVEDQTGPLLDRSLENLCSTDLAIITVRRKLLRILDEVDASRPLEEPFRPQDYDLRPVDIVLPQDVTLEEGAAKYVLPGGGASVVTTNNNF